MFLKVWRRPGAGQTASVGTVAAWTSSLLPVCVFYSGKSVGVHVKFLHVNCFISEALITQYQTTHMPVRVPAFVVVSMETFSPRRVWRQTGLGLSSFAGFRGHILLGLWTDAESASCPSGPVQS